MSALNWKRLESAKLHTDPFQYFHVADALDPQAAARVPAEFPSVPGPGSFSLHDAPPGPVLTEVIADLQSGRFRALMSRLFDLDLTDASTMVTIRGESGPRDGFIHRDSRSKILSLLLYLNEDWAGGEGQLRLLRSRSDIEAVAAEIPSGMGSLVVFRRSDNSWHGHTPYHGRRRVLQFNYVRGAQTGVVSNIRHRLSAMAKRL
ncbi:2OG-Fe(II) oxygenase [Phenylobacterium sp.]|uniref:2OG-Fe(II) oxygenase n=1 Tax=Phenylobacterium sp. TaxID=1871053 RepID=UPI002DF0A60A|nr:2OG-Fe(II) oxygenase [Phenylobacterium sp.]